MEKFNFNISLSVLNHLGRNLYRNFLTVLGEAISNSWDADAKNVWININKDNHYMSILDDGDGMDSEAFQGKFLKIGYSKRRNNITKSPQGRPYIGRKGIGKLALLSCAEKIHIATKALGKTPVGGIIDNTDLDAAITDDLTPQEYDLETITQDKIDLINKHEKGTVLCFENITDDIVNSIDYIKKAIALFFKFSLVDKDFNIFVNDDLITCKMLKDLAAKTQYVWIINDFTAPYLDPKESSIAPQRIVKLSSFLPIKGYIATTTKPVDIKIRGTNEKVTLDLFVNGRLREKDLLKHIPTSRIVESYTYGEIYFDSLDSGIGKDIFTSSRESVISNDPDFRKMIDELNRIYRGVLDQWDDFRRADGADGDPDNPKLPPKARKAQELFNQTYRDMNLLKPKKSRNKDDEKQEEHYNPIPEWVNNLSIESQFNIPSYAECFISENLLRKYIEYTKTQLSSEAKSEAQKWRTRENGSKEAANISYQVRQSEDDIYYLDMNNLANLVDKVHDPKSAGLSRSATIYKPLRDSVGHTSLLTNAAKTQLTLEYSNIQARLVKLLNDLAKN